MAKIITVHGTGASGPAEGEKWWQKGSEFETHIRELVEGADGTALQTQRLIWDGANSETSRRKAAGELYEEVQKFETIGEKYCLVGHSHGGSIIANVLLLAGYHGNQLPNLMRLITVATPFIQSRKASSLFSRSGLIGRSMVVAIFLALVSLPSIIWFGEPGVSPSNLGLGFLAFFGICVLCYFGLPYSLLWAFNRRRFYMYQPKVLRFASVKFANRMVSIRHVDDEAINALGSLTNLTMPIFPSNFAVSTLSIESLFILPLLLVIAAAIGPFYHQVINAVGLTPAYQEEEVVFMNFIDLVSIPFRLIVPYVITPEVLLNTGPIL
jgi:hypothetical protein